MSTMSIETTTLRWDETTVLARKAVGSQSEFLIFMSEGTFNLVQRKQVNKTRPGAHVAQAKFHILRQETGLTLDVAKAQAQAWENAGLPERKVTFGPRI